jgi:hypothetical protein
MKKLSIFLVLIGLTVGVYAMTYESKPMKTVDVSHSITREVKELDDFNKIEIQGGAIEVDVTYTYSTEEVVVEALERLQKHVELKVKSGKLTVNIANGVMSNYNGSIKLHIKTKKLSEFVLSGASSVHLSNTLNNNSLIIKSTGAASFNGEVKVKEVNIKLDGAATVNLSGKASKTRLELSGASQVNDYAFEVDNLDVELSGASSVQITSKKKIEGNLSGASSLTYAGTPSIEGARPSGASRIQPKID